MHGWRHDGALPSPVRSSLPVILGVAVTACAILVVARTAGATASLDRLVPLAALVLLAMWVPVDVGGWGPREGAATWAFGSAGMGAAQGLSTAVVYGVIVLVATFREPQYWRSPDAALHGEDGGRCLTARTPC